MKKTAVYILIAAIITAAAAAAVIIINKEDPQTAETTASRFIPYPPGETDGPVDSGAYVADMGDQILAEDDMWSVTGRDFEYINGYIGTAAGGSFDICTKYVLGSEENFIFGFEYVTDGDGALYLGLDLLGEDSLPGTEPEVWLVFGRSSVSLYGGEEIPITPDTADPKKIRIEADQINGVSQIYINGEKTFTLTVKAGGKMILEGNGGKSEADVTESVYIGGNIKLRSAPGKSVYVRNVSFQLN